MTRLAFSKNFLWEMEQRDSAASTGATGSDGALRHGIRRLNKVAAIWNRFFEDYQRGHVLNIKDAPALEGVSRS
jgi:hypothetical protein